MRILVTAGNTQVPIDQVRCITNIFTGRTGARIALEACRRGHDVTLATSHPESLREDRACDVPRLRVHPYKTFDDLHRFLEKTVPGGSLDAIIHCAAVSDYRVAGVYAPAPGTSFEVKRGHWQTRSEAPQLAKITQGKVTSSHPELWLRLEPTPKLVDKMRTAWGFRGILVKFKLEVGIDEQQLLSIAEQARLQSDANLMVANTLEGMNSWAYLGPVNGAYRKVGRDELPAVLLDEVEALQGGG